MTFFSWSNLHSVFCLTLWFYFILFIWISRPLLDDFRVSVLSSKKFCVGRKSEPYGLNRFLMEQIYIVVNVIKWTQLSWLTYLCPIKSLFALDFEPIKSHQGCSDRSIFGSLPRCRKWFYVKTGCPNEQFLSCCILRVELLRLHRRHWLHTRSENKSNFYWKNISSV